MLELSPLLSIATEYYHEEYKFKRPSCSGATSINGEAFHII